MTGERVQRYAEAILDNFHGPDTTHSTWWLNTDEMGAAVRAVADAEQAELRAEIERLRGTLVGTALTRMDAADAAVARVQAILNAWAAKADEVEPTHGEQVISVRHIVERFTAALEDRAPDVVRARP